jgi:hypothetical protein
MATPTSAIIELSFDRRLLGRCRLTASETLPDFARDSAVCLMGLIPPSGDLRMDAM